MSIQTNSEALQRILQTVQELPEAESGNTGVTVQRKSGTFTINTHNSATGGSATVDCGFQPDVVYLQGRQGYVAQENLTTSSSTAIVFAEENRGNPLTAMPAPDAHYQMLWTRRSNGFAIEMVKFASDWSISVLNETFNYVAIKYT